MATSKRRIEQLEGSLSPCEAVLLWMNAAHESGTLQGYFDSMKDAPEAKYPMMHLPEQVEQAVRTAMKGQQSEAIQQAVRRAVREVAFLFYLHMQVNTRLLAEWRAMCLHLAYVASHLGHLYTEDHPSAEKLAEARHRACDAVVEFLVWDVAVQKIGGRYFAGACPLFPAPARQLAESLQHAEQVVGIFNDHLEWLDYLANSDGKPATKRPAKQRKQAASAGSVTPIDLAEIKHEVAPYGVDLARHIVIMAQAEAAEFMGETREALAIMRARLWPGTE